MSARALVLLLLAVATGGCARQEIVRRNEQLFRAIADRDQPALDDLLAPDFHFEASGGQGGDRRRFFDVNASTPGAVLAIDNDQLRFERDGDRARLCGRQRAIVLLDGKSVVDEARFCDRWERRGGRWLVTFAGPGDDGRR
jgi:hypothetical protein